MSYEQARNEGRGLVFRKKIVWLGALSLLVMSAMFLAACGSDDDSSSDSGSGSSSSSGETISMLTWDGYQEKEWLNEFTADTGIKVKSTSAGSPAEMFAKVRSNPEQFDVVLPTAGWFPQYVEAGLLEPIDTSKVPAMDDIKLGFPWKDAASVDGELYGVLYNWGNQPLAWLPDKIKGVDLSKYENEEGVIDDWNVLWDPQLKGKVSVFDDPTSVEPMVALSLGFEDPYNLDEQQFEEFRQKLLDLRPQVKRLTTGYDDQTAQLASGEAWIAYLNIISIASTLRKDGTILEVNNTVKQGVPAWSDNYAITSASGADKADAVYELMNYTLSLDWQARFVAETSNSGTLNYEQATSSEAEAQGLTKKILDTTLIPATREGDKFFNSQIFFQPVEDTQARLDVWNEFKLGLGG
ncbi:MAG: extracellular solute-binding protein [Solirubrobacterales bacterium]|nr:extracellular solute-binding protein [Solirubrobacterales bacterium]